MRNILQNKCLQCLSLQPFSQLCFNRAPIFLAADYSKIESPTFAYKTSCIRMYTYMSAIKSDINDNQCFARSRRMKYNCSFDNMLTPLWGLFTHLYYFFGRCPMLLLMPLWGYPQI
jgi:hypothetical protein